jgi:NitT/TauT family transport system substrate-binding protein
MKRAQTLILAAGAIASCVAWTTVGLAQAIRVTLGITNSVTDVGFMVAQKRGYFRDEGLDVRFIDFDSAARMITPMATGDMDVGSGAASAGLYNAVARGIDIKIVAGKNQTPYGRPSQTMVVRKDLVESGRYKTLADLKGMRIANVAPGSSAMATMNKILEKGGLKPDDIQEVYMGFSQQITALSNKAVDAALPAEPQATQSIRDGNIGVIRDYEVYPDHQISVLLYSGQFAKQKPDAARRFMKAFLRGVRDHEDSLVDGRFAGAKGEAIIAILTEFGPIKDPEVYRSFVLSTCPPDGEINLASLKEDYSVFQKGDLLKGTVTVEQTIDPTFVNWAVKELGPYKRRN